MANKARVATAEAASVAERVAGIDPAKSGVAVSVLDERGGVLGTAHFKISGVGHRAMLEWAEGFGPVGRWGIEGASGLGRHTAMFLIDVGHDVRDVCPNRTHGNERARQRGKSDALDSVRIARETQRDPGLAKAFKRAGGDDGPDETHELLTLVHRSRMSLKKSRQHLLNEAEALLVALPLQLRDALPDSKDVRKRLKALQGRDQARSWDPVTALRLRTLDDHWRWISELDTRDKELAADLAQLIARAGSTLGELRGLAERSVAELLVETGDPRRFTEGGYARFNGTAPIPASTGDGGNPTRYRYNPGGNRRINAVLHRMAVTQLRCHPPARTVYDNARSAGHSKAEAMRVLKRHLSNAVYRRMTRDVAPSAEGAAPTAAAA